MVDLLRVALRVVRILSAGAKEPGVNIARRRSKVLMVLEPKGEISVMVLVMCFGVLKIG